jgi:ACS family hexuronate transporter-like MFS transporter
MDSLNGAKQEMDSLPRPLRGAGRVRWWIVWTLFFSTVTNYISRQTFSVLSPMLAVQFHLSHTDIAKILGAFQMSYAVTWLLGGIFLDAFGTRLGLALAVSFWSLVNIITGFADSTFGFAASRFFLGVGEGFNWPGASKTVAEWFPNDERGIAVAIFDSGSSVGGALAAMIIPWVAIEFGWRWSFVFSGMLGFIWLAMWLYMYHPVDMHPRVTAAEVALIRAGQETFHRSDGHGVAKWLSLAKSRNVWGIVLGRALTDPIWWFYVFWLPQYLSDARGFSLQRIAMFAWLPFVAADLGNFTGGLISHSCIRRGVPVIRARMWVCAISCLPILAGIPAARVHNTYAGADMCCSLGLCKLVHDGTHSSFRSVSAGCCRHCNRPQRICSGSGQHGFHFGGGLPGRSFLLHSGLRGCGTDAHCCHSLFVFLDQSSVG